ncbi:MAG: V-type ATP synthase subunit D [Actinobacteria bacterium]|nr:V-type ATP synthase subunit D [Actinomycetota bacterium]
MPQKKINPNRMELMKLKKRLRLAVRGHKLMKDKFDELLKEFFELAKGVYKKRKIIERKLLEAYGVWARELALHEYDLLPVLSKSISRSIRVQRVVTRRVGTEYISFKTSIEEDLPLIFTFEWSPKIQETLKNSKELVTELIELAGMEISLRNLASEMERTRRRVNALEQVLIPQIESQIKQVQAKLDELDRESRTRVAKVKDMLEKRSA